MKTHFRLRTPWPAALLAIAAALVARPALAKPSTDNLQATPGFIRVTALFHASTELDYRGRTILIDPIAAPNYSRRADIILITHTHADHFDPATIARELKPGGTLVVPPVAFEQVLALNLPGAKIKVLRNFQNTKVTYGPPLFAKPKILQTSLVLPVPARPADNWDTGFDIRIKAVPAYNIVRGPDPMTKYHPKGLFNGYVITMGNDRIYVAGDTEVTPEMKGLKNITAAFLPMNLPYTMTPQEAAAGARAFAPKVVYPYHYRYPFNQPNDNPEQFAAALKGTHIQVRLLEWYPDYAVTRAMSK